MLMRPLGETAWVRVQGADIVHEPAWAQAGRHEADISDNKDEDQTKHRVIITRCVGWPFCCDKGIREMTFSTRTGNNRN